MNLSENEYKKILFLTRTNISEARIKRLGKYFTDFNLLLDRINKLNHPDLDHDWSLFDFEYIDDKKIYSSNIQIINEENIFKGTYTHKCKNSRNYLIQIIGTSGFCRRCDTQFFPELWWNHPLKDDLSYKEIKYGANVPFIKQDINEEYLQRLLKTGVDRRIIYKTLSNIHSPLEIEKMLNTKMYDWKNPPLASKVHAKLIYLNNIWETRPVISLGIFNEDRYFFHRCGTIEKILFNERLLYPWCPSCFTKFIPAWDKESINNYKNHFTIDTFGSSGDVNNNGYSFNIENSEESFYLSVLGLDKNATIEIINITFRKLSKIYHPDTGGDSVSFQEIVKAKNWLIKNLKKTNSKFI